MPNTEQIARGVYLVGGPQISHAKDAIHSPFLPVFGSDIALWRTSMEMIMALKPDILCEGHFGIFRPNDSIEHYIRRCLHHNA
jgi:hypothetical protein